MAKEEAGEEKAKEGDGHGEAAKPKSKKMLIIIIAAVVLVVGGAAAFFLLGGKKEDAEGHGEEQHEEERHLGTGEMDSFIVNLSETSNFLKVKILVEFDTGILEKGSAHAEGGGGHEGGGEGEAKASLPGVLGVRMPMIRDAVIRVVSSKKAADVLTPEGKEQLKEEIVEAMNEASGLEEGPIVAIYFIEFIVQ